MSLYNQYTIHQNDTLQKIAYFKLGDVSLWTKIRDINNLKYPYIVDTIEQKQQDINHLVSLGDTIYLPKLQQDVNEEDIDNLTVDSYTKDILYDTVMGRDIEVGIDIDSYLDDSDAIIIANQNNTDFKSISGLSNLYQSLIMRIFTRKGALILHPNYGSTFVDFIGEPLTYENIRLAECELSKTILTDSRVSSCKVSSEQLTGDSVSFSAYIKPVNEDEQLSIYITIMNTGRVFIS